MHHIGFNILVKVTFAFCDSTEHIPLCYGSVENSFFQSDTINVGFHREQTTNILMLICWYTFLPFCLYKRPDDGLVKYIETCSLWILW
jgi:hypothetical protein